MSRSSPLTLDGELLSLYRALKLVETESLRVAVTIDALEKNCTNTQIRKISSNYILNSGA
jgi:hypothetical protein